MRTFADAINFLESQLAKSVSSKGLARVSEQVLPTPFHLIKDSAFLNKSKSFVAPIARQVMHRNISLKDALDSVPWWMQSELLKYLKDHD